MAVYSILHLSMPSELLVSHLQFINSFFSQEGFSLLKKGNVRFTLFSDQFSIPSCPFATSQVSLGEATDTQPGWMFSAFFNTTVRSPELEENICASVLFPNSAEYWVQKAYQVILMNTDFSRVSLR